MFYVFGEYNILCNRIKKYKRTCLIPKLYFMNIIIIENHKNTVPLLPKKSLNMLDVDAARPLRSELMFEKKSRCVAVSKLVVCSAVESRRAEALPFES